MHKGTPRKPWDILLDRADKAIGLGSLQGLGSKTRSIREEHQSLHR